MTKDKIAVTLGAILFISLSINLFMAGSMVGGSVGAPHKVVSDTAEQDRQLRETLPDADKLILKEAMDANRKKITQLHDDLDNIKNDIRKIIKQDTVDEKALGDVLEDEKKKELAILRLAHETRKAATDKMSPEGRAIMAKVGRLGFNLNNQCH